MHNIADPLPATTFAMDAAARTKATLGPLFYFALANTIGQYRKIGCTNSCAPAIRLSLQICIILRRSFGLTIVVLCTTSGQIRTT